MMMNTTNKACARKPTTRLFVVMLSFQSSDHSGTLSSIYSVTRERPGKGALKVCFDNWVLLLSAVCRHDPEHQSSEVSEQIL